MQFDITIHGKGGHGSRPDNSYNPIECLPPVYAAMQQLPGGVRITSVVAGTSGNIIPNDLRFSGICADENYEQLKDIINNLCGVYHCTAEFN